MLISEYVTERPLLGGKNSKELFPTLSLSISTGLPVGTSTDTCCLICLHQRLHPHAPVEPSLPVTLASVPKWQVLPRRASPTHTHASSPDMEVLGTVGSGSSGPVATGLFSHSRPGHTCVKLATFTPGAKQCPQQAKRASADYWPDR